MVTTEVTVVRTLNHPNIINILDYEEKAYIEKKDGKSYEVRCAVVEELAGGGELFYFVLNSGHFSTRVAIYYFNELL